VTLRVRPLVAVADVEASSRFYQRLLGAASGHGGREYERVEVDGEVVLQLHALEVSHHHGALADAEVRRGNGVALWFVTGDFDTAAGRAHELAAPIVHDVHINPNSGLREIWLHDPDGYLVVLSEG
jgi:catechol 2,3-dioxygenase-like lactoylglutathione lyase family enzyme